MAIDYIPPDLDGEGLRIGIVQARFNEWAGQALAQACIGELLNLGVDEGDITHVTVPGSLEVPLALAKLAANEDFDALIGLGAVIRILTCDTDEQARARVNEKGRDAARVAV
ncbi:MAG: 6,7-dimethyl-8-ribityllumazine synthase, partial [Burkholderiaceae bacterium]|nr:6,7-dimethyl-8-ribityllumazine synthase [Burkholderiaceae bacterium]